MELKIISGGQTGADIAGLRVGRVLGFPTGGRAPKGWATLDGPKPELAQFGLTESMNGYRGRTIENVQAADATLVFSKNLKSPGTVLTINAARKYGKPCFVMRDAREPGQSFEEAWANGTTARAELERANDFLDLQNRLGISTIINVAGNATKNAKEAFEFAFIGLILLLSPLVGGDIQRLTVRDLHRFCYFYKDRYDDLDARPS